MKSYVYFISFLLYAVASCQMNTASDTVSDTVLVCKGTSSYAYHDHPCEGLNRCRAAIEKVSVTKAKAMGRTPCRYCYKPVAPAGSEQTLKPAKQPSVPGQCTAITKKGTRCSRNARAGGRCWQHGG